MSLKDAMSSPMIKKVLSFAIMLVFIGVLSAMTILSGSGSTILAGIFTTMVQFKELIALGISLGVVAMFMR